MGYSCRVECSDTCQVIENSICRPFEGSSNTYTDGKAKYFFEVGREQADGAMTGTVYKFVDAERCRKAGTFRIDPDGSIVRFPGIPRAKWPAIQKDAAARRQRIYADIKARQYPADVLAGYALDALYP